MSDQIKHECGVALVRLLKPLPFYHARYGTSLYGLNKMRLLLQKMRNRGQDGAGFGSVKLGAAPGKQYIDIHRSANKNYLEDLFKHIYSQFKNLTDAEREDPLLLKHNRPFMGELMIGHLRYGTHGDNSIKTCHPFHRASNWISRNLVLAGNFNMTNVHELFDELVGFGQYPNHRSDTVTVLEKIGHFLDDEIQRLHGWYKPDGYDNTEINKLIFDNLDLQRLLKRACKRFDGGYTIAGMIGHGDAFVIRDPSGIRPAFYYADEEVVAVASERPAIQTAFNVHHSMVQEVKPGHALIIKHDGRIEEKPYLEPRPKTSCSFERIYFSRGTDRDIYLERKKLGELLTDRVLKAVKYDIKHTVFSYVPNTAETAFLGLSEGVIKWLNQRKIEKITEQGPDIKPKKLEKILSINARMEKVIVKDAKLRTFIADNSSRKELVSHVYDVTYGIVENERDTLVIMDDSIVRGTTLRESILSIVSRLRPKKIIVVSSAPQIRYPDCYGIDMSRMKEFVAFRALVELLEDTNQEHLLEECYERCVASEYLPIEQVENELIPLYATFTEEEISAKIAQIVTPPNIKPKVEVIYQTIEHLHQACPNHKGDWYFSGNYPTPGGTRVANRSFINYMKKSEARAY